MSSQREFGDSIRKELEGFQAPLPLVTLDAEFKRRIDRISSDINSASTPIAERSFEFPTVNFDLESKGGILPIVKNQISRDYGNFRGWVVEGTTKYAGEERKMQMILVGGDYPKDHDSTILSVEGSDDFYQFDKDGGKVWTPTQGPVEGSRRAKFGGPVDFDEAIRAKVMIDEFKPDSTYLSAESMYTKSQEVVIRNIFKSGLIKFGDFRLTDGRISPYIFNMPSRKDQHSLASMLGSDYASLIEMVHADIVASDQLASEYVGKLVLDRLKMPGVSVFKKYDWGNGQVSGFEPTMEGQEAVILSDTAGTGGTILRNVDALRKRNINVKTAVVLIDRQEGAKEPLAREGVRLMAILGSREMFDYAREARTPSGDKVISESDYQRVMEYLESYRAA